MTVPATDDLRSVSPAGLGNYRTGSSIADDKDEHDDTVVAAQDLSKLTFSAIVHNAKQELPSMTRSESEGQDSDDACLLAPVRITQLGAFESTEESDTGHELDSKPEEPGHKAEDLESYMQRASEGLKRHESWAEAVVEMAMKIQGGHQDKEAEGVVGSLESLSSEWSVQAYPHDDAARSKTLGQTSQLPAAATDATPEEDEQARAEELLKTVAAGPLPAADSLWSDDDEGGC